MTDPTDTDSPPTAEQHYRQDRGLRYHEQRQIARALPAQQWRSALFGDIADKDAITLDFGCGNGGVLGLLPARKRIGVEINEFAAADARERLDLVVDDLGKIESHSVDIVISYHAFEHVEHPANGLRELYRILRAGGRARIIVPTEMPLLLKKHRSWRSGDPDMHLFTWTPLLLGNLMSVCGFEVVRAELDPISQGGKLAHLFPKGSRGRRFAAYLKALSSGKFQSVVTARKPG